MEVLPRVKDVLQDGCSEALQLIRARASTQKLHVPGGVKLTVSRVKLGQSLYHPPTDFLNMGPLFHLMKPSYNSLHDPHLHRYHCRRQMHDALSKGKYVTKDDEVLCSLKEYNLYEAYLRTHKIFADRAYDEAQRDKMKTFVELQEKGLLPCDVTLAEVTEVLLEDGVEKRRQLVLAEAARLKNKQKGPATENGSKQNGTGFYTELYTRTWNADDRSRLMMYERQFRYEQNKKNYLRASQKEKDRKKHAALAQKCAIHHKDLQETLKIADGSAKEHAQRSKLRGDKFRLVPPGGNQYPLCRRQSMETRILRSDQLSEANSTEHRQGTLEHDQECDEDSQWMEDSGENPEVIDETLQDEPHVDIQCLLPEQRPFHLPPLRTGQRQEEMDQKCAIL